MIKIRIEKCVGIIVNNKEYKMLKYYLKKYNKDKLITSSIPTYLNMKEAKELKDAIITLIDAGDLKTDVKNWMDLFLHHLRVSMIG